MFWSIPAGSGPGTAFHEMYPDGGANLVLRLSPTGCRAVLLGPATEKASVEVDEDAEYLGVRFRVGEAPRLSDVPPAELTDRHADLAHLGGVGIDALGERLLSLRELGARQRLLETLLLPAPPLVRDERARRAARLLEARGGQVRVDEVASALGVHVRTLERLFLEHLGVRPKRLARLVRLRHLLTRLHAGRHDGLAGLALACGYADQAHMIREMKALTGRSPGERDASRTRRLASADENRVVHRHRR